MKISKLLITFYFILISFAGFSRDIEINKKLNIDPSVKFETLWVEHNVIENNITGMRVHVSFKAMAMKGMDALVALYFYYDDEEPLIDKNFKFYTTDANVAAFASIKPNYDPAIYKDFKIFMPYSELDLDPGDYDLFFDAAVIKKEGGTIGDLTTYYFSYTQPEKNNLGNNDSKKINIVFKDMTVDYGYKKDSLTGIQIHLNFSTENLKDTAAYAIVYFAYKDNSRVMGRSANYSSKNGQLIVFRKIKPNYDIADYKDLILFMPYDEIPGTGKIDMKMIAKVIKPDGTVLKALGEKSFLFTR